jgi:hypothetical protein
MSSSSIDIPSPQRIQNIRSIKTSYGITGERVDIKWDKMGCCKKNGIIF